MGGRMLWAASILPEVPLSIFHPVQPASPSPSTLANVEVGALNALLTSLTTPVTLCWARYSCGSVGSGLMADLLWLPIFVLRKHVLSLTWRPVWVVSLGCSGITVSNGSGPLLASV